MCITVSWSIDSFESLNIAHYISSEVVGTSSLKKERFSFYVDNHLVRNTLHREKNCSKKVSAPTIVSPGGEMLSSR